MTTPQQGTRQFSHVLDELIRIPGTNIRVGLDGLFSLIPGAGDAAGVVMSVVILIDAVRCRVPIPTLIQMIGRVAADAALGVIPGVGPFIDMAYRSNSRNMKLLDRAIASGKTSKRRGVGYILATIGIIVGSILALVIGVIALALWLLNQIKIGG